MDAYCHLDMECESPIADFEGRMRAAGVTRALLVETWNGRNRPLLESVLRGGEQDKFCVALCYREERSRELRGIAQRGGLPAIRMSTEDLCRDRDFCRDICQGSTFLVTHAEAGIGALCDALTCVHVSAPDLRIYVPHLAWPANNGAVDGDWEDAIEDLVALPTVIIGVSAIAHFSNEPFPHHDVRDFALHLISRLPASRIAIGSDYPLFDKERYRDYMSLARDWVTTIHSDWSFAF